MDQLRTILRVMWQQRFWLATTIGVLVAVLCWMVASGTIDDEFVKKQGEIKTKVSAMQSLSSQQVHGNPRVNAKELEQTAAIRDSVRVLWQELYERQREQVLKWPAVLGDDFVDYVEGRQFGSGIKYTHRDTYWNYIKDRFDGLLEIVDAKKMLDQNAAGPGGGRGEFGGEFGGYQAYDGAEGYGTGEFPLEEDYLVQWIDQGRVRAKLTFRSRPSAMQIWVTQEDLWVYETLLKVIANVNKEKGATRPDQTAIRAIIALEVGREAAQAGRATGNILMPAGGAPGGYGGEGGYPEGGMEFDGGRGGMEFSTDGYGGEGGAGDESQLDAMLTAGRYVDAGGQPVEYTATQGEQFRRLPIHMTLLMDQRYLPSVLVEAGNAPLPIEVNRVRINPEKSGQGVESALADAASAGGGYGGGEFGGGRGGGYGGGEFSGGGYGGGEYGSPSSADLTAMQAGGLETVDILGVVYIYQPPNEEVLSLPGEESGAAEGALPVTDDGTADL